MSCSAFRQILAVLGHDERAVSAVLERAVDLAETKRARLTLAKTTDPGWIVRWFGPLAMLSRAGCVAEFDLQTFARDQLARAAEFVPASIPLTTVLLDTDTPAALHELAGAHVYDLLVVDCSQARSLRLRRELRRLQICALMVSPDATSGTSLLRDSAVNVVAR